MTAIKHWSTEHRFHALDMRQLPRCKISASTNNHDHRLFIHPLLSVASISDVPSHLWTVTCRGESIFYWGVLSGGGEGDGVIRTRWSQILEWSLFKPLIQTCPFEAFSSYVFLERPLSRCVLVRILTVCYSAPDKTLHYYFILLQTKCWEIRASVM